MKCPNCVDGREVGIFPIYPDDVPIEKRKRVIIMKCPCCLGKNEIDKEQLKKIEDGKKIRARRIEKNLTLREYCETNNISIHEQNKLERGF